MTLRLGRLAMVVIAALAGAVAAAGPASAGGHAVRSRSYVFVDKSRSTPPNGTYPGARTRTLPTLLLSPAEGKRRPRGPFPLIVFSHGLGATGPAFRPTLERLARKGYVVAAPTFPLSNGSAPGGPSLVDYEEQPADVSFVLDRVLRLARRNRDGLRRTISRRRIGALGHSLGAVTTLALTANSCCLDRRIDAAVSWAGLLLPFTGGSYFSMRTPPLMLVHGTADPTYSASVSIYGQAPSPKAFVTLTNAPHILNVRPWMDPAVSSTADWFDGFLEHDRKALRRLATDANVPGTASLETAGLD